MAAFCAAVVAAPAAGASADALRPVELKRCGKVDDGDGRSPVRAAKLPCRRARELAKAFIQDDEIARGWRANNPAGCEWFLFRKGDRDEFREWFFGDGGRVDFKLVALIKMRGCES